MTFKFIWPRLSTSFYNKTDEAIFLFEYLTSDDKLQLVSNYPYEIFVNKVFLGDGGVRCPNKEAYIDTWDLVPGADKNVLVRLHWMSAKLTSVFHRCLFTDPFLGFETHHENWTCRMDLSVKFMAKINSQLPCQNLIINDLFSKLGNEFLDIEEIDRSYWNIIPLPIKRVKYILIENLEKKIVKKIKLRKQKDKARVDYKDLHTHVVDQRPHDMFCTTYDLGTIALYRFEVEKAVDLIFSYTEVSDFETAFLTPNRRKVHMADGFSSPYLSYPFGQRGCRYLHVISKTENPGVKIRVFRREYPLDFVKTRPLPNSTLESILSACRNNLLACTDGGIVDTCWRERAQWTGDAYISTMALKSLTNNPEVGSFVLGQIAMSYNPKTGLVGGCTPAKTVDYRLEMPTYHLAFCLAYTETGLGGDLVKSVVKKSMRFWRDKYIKEGILTGLNGWNFVDWDFTNEHVVGKQNTVLEPNAVCHAWYQKVCDGLKIPSGLDKKKFISNFYTGRGFCLMAAEKGKNDDNIHATAAVLVGGGNLIGDEERVNAELYLEKQIKLGNVSKCVTPYYAYFIAKALSLSSVNAQDKTFKFIEDYYGEMVKKYGTIQEKVSDGASLAHGWSVGVASLLVDHN